MTELTDVTVGTRHAGRTPRFAVDGAPHPTGDLLIEEPGRTRFERAPTETWTIADFDVRLGAALRQGRLPHQGACHVELQADVVGADDDDAADPAGGDEVYEYGVTLLAAEGQRVRRDPKLVNRPSVGPH